MAVSCHVAFGHYLRTLRERRGLALEEVWSLSQTFPETLNKGYMSRCENGKQKLALPKVVAISRIYEVPSDVLVERLELDLELEKIGGPATEGLSWAQLREAGKNAMGHGHRWAAYAFLRDATFNVEDAELDTSTYESLEEQRIGAFMNAASSAQTLGKNQYAEYEFLFAEKSGALNVHSLVFSAERLGVVNWHLRRPERAQSYADKALSRLEDTSACPFEGFVYDLHGFLRYQRGEESEAISWYQKAYDTYRSLRMIRESAHSLICLADSYYESGKVAAAGRTLDVALGLCDEHSLVRIRALALTLFSLIDQEANRSPLAESRLREAQDIARDLNDRVLKFQVDFYLYKHALAQDRVAAARAICRRLSKLAVSIPETVEQVAEFKLMQGKQLD